MKKNIIIIVAIIIAILIGIYVVKKNEMRSEYKLVKVTGFDYFKYISDDKCGVIDKNGNKIIEAKYSDVIIPNPQRDVFFCYENEIATVINSKGERLYQDFSNVEPIKLKNVATTLNYEKEIFKFEKDGLFGLINIDGKQIIKPEYESIENLQLREGILLVKQKEKYGIINGNGFCIIKPEYDGIMADGFYLEEYGYSKSGYIVSSKSQDGYRYGYISNDGRKYLEQEFNSIERIDNYENYKELYLIVSKNGKYGVYKNKKKIIEEDYQSIEYNGESKLLLIEKNKKYGVADLQGNFIINTENVSIEFKGVYLYVQNGLNNMVYNVNGDKINISFNKKIYETDSEFYRISTLENNNVIYYGIVEKNGNNLVSEKYLYLEYVFGSDFIFKDENGKYGIINSNGRELIESKYDMIQKVRGKNILQAVNNETGITEIYNSSLELLYSLKGANISNEENYVKVVSEGQTMYLDVDGNEIIESNIISSSDSLIEPERVGKYKKVQFTLENVYYVE